MEQCKLDRISELTRLSKCRELTSEECSERQILREEYLAEWRKGTKQTLDRVYIVDETGKKRKLTK
ncbi:MAG: DUF896 domain-containing protein [Clostridia bacterium]|nr:DUF896 domain-containing protein [Clostridia bacterium]